MLFWMLIFSFPPSLFTTCSSYPKAAEAARMLLSDLWSNRELQSILKQVRDSKVVFFLYLIKLRDRCHFPCGECALKSPQNGKEKGKVFWKTTVMIFFSLENVCFID